MMVLSALRPDASLPEFLAHRARSASISRLVAEQVAALSMLAATLWWTPRAQMLIACAAICVASYATWGLLDRARAVATGRGRPKTARALHVTGVFVAAIGIGAGCGVLLSIWAYALGTWIS